MASEYLFVRSLLSSSSYFWLSSSVLVLHSLLLLYNSWSFKKISFYYFNFFDKFIKPYIGLRNFLITISIGLSMPINLESWSVLVVSCLKIFRNSGSLYLNTFHNLNSLNWPFYIRLGTDDVVVTFVVRYASFSFNVLW